MSGLPPEVARYPAAQVQHGAGPMDVVGLRAVSRARMHDLPAPFTGAVRRAHAITLGHQL